MFDWFRPAPVPLCSDAISFYVVMPALQVITVLSCFLLCCWLPLLDYFAPYMPYEHSVDCRVAVPYL